MIFEFIFLYNWLNIAFFIFNKKETIQKIGLLKEEAIEIFEYRKNNKGYWDGAKLY